MRDEINSALKTAIKAKEQTRVSTLRLIIAAIKDRDIAVRSEDRTTGITDEEILGVLQKMVRQRQESASLYEEGGRLELAERERAEIAVIEEFLPKPLSPEEAEAAIRDAIAEVDASGVKDMGKVMGLLKQRFPGRLDIGKASGRVKSILCGA
ncbi:MAG: GatB/YqeY domain-containing protein [Alphaproteobacteria bacterium]|nr:GatB/YqeY domain-containing protein [Alphaproteobacteria bacterium]MDX5370224.1 GatB/YqeY domain-containing protein [Alphaproteobacteria bacterium]MDX5464774.1 GatB/YqeY domain-containing protein [Alphaproteobacteria bacterium]